MSKIHNVARSGFDAGGSSGLYDRARPSYPAEVISSILSSASQGKAEGEGLRLVELGAGTGICTRLLLAAATEAPYKLASLNAIEPSSGMRTALSQSLATLNMGPDASVTVQDGTFEHFDAGANNDAVIVAQAFHWCQDFDAAVTQAANSLRPGGVLALLWNLEDRDAAPWVAQIRDMYEKYEGDAPQYRHGNWKGVLSAPSFSRFFRAETPVHVARRLPTTLDGVKDRMLSKSYICNLTQEERDVLVAKVDKLFAESSDAELGRTWIEKDLGVWEYPYRTDLFLFRRKD